MGIKERTNNNNNNNPDCKRTSTALTADDMILYTEIPKDTVRKLLELINEFSKVIGYKQNRNPLHSYTITMEIKKEIKE